MSKKDNNQDDKLYIPLEAWKQNNLNLALPLFACSAYTEYMTEDGYMVNIRIADKIIDDDDDYDDMCDIIIKDRDGKIFWQANFKKRF